MRSASHTSAEGIVPERVDAVDQLRGLAVLMLIVSTIGPRAVFAIPRSDVVELLREQLRPALWQGVTLADLCWPMFLFVSGMSLALSIERRQRAGEGSARIVGRHVRRGVALFVIGFLLSGGFSVAWPLIVWAGPLQQLGVSVLLGVMIAKAVTRWQARFVVGVSLLSLHGGLLAFCPFPGDEQGRLDFVHNLAAFVDHRLLPGRTFYTHWDPHGIGTTLPALGTLLLGLAVGTALTTQRSTQHRVIGVSLLVALVCVNGGLLIHQLQPDIPSLMTPAFVLLATGLCLFARAGGLTLEVSSSGMRFGQPLAVLGRNSLLLVVVLSLHSLTAVSDVLVGGDVSQFLREIAPLCRFAIELAALWTIAWFLFRRKVFVTI